jgi:NADH:ubiquinone oxidoreductase subunit 2 (subunit N)
VEVAVLPATGLTTALFSLAGLPIFAGFLTKFILFQAAAKEGFLWLSALAVVNSVISLYHYLSIIKHMYTVEPEEMTRFRVPLTVNGSLAVLGAGVFLIGFCPGPLFKIPDNITRFLFS